MKRKLFFRVDGNATIGRGHISRCVAISDMICNVFDIVFVVLKVNESFFEKLFIPYNYTSIAEDNDIFGIIERQHIVWLDGYHFDENYKANVRKNVYKLIETNDIPYNVKNVDILFNHTPNISINDFKVDSEDIKLFLGLEYTLLRQQFLKIARDQKINSKGVGVFICFGGADTFNLGYKFVNSLVKSGFSDFIYWVTNSDENIAKESLGKNVVVLSNLAENDMIRYIEKSKVVLIPSSVLSFEAMAINKPIFTGYFVDNQKLTYKGLIYKGLASGFGYSENDEHVLTATNSFLKYYENECLHVKHVGNQQKLIDGNSGVRIKDVILEL